MSDLRISYPEESQTADSPACEGEIGLLNAWLDPIMSHSSEANRWRRFCHNGAIVEYPENVRWMCARCTFCCKDAHTHERCIRILANEVLTICLEAGLREADFSIPFTHSPPYTHEMRKPKGKCYFLQGELCSIYAIRPITCVFYPFFLKRIDDKRFRFDLTPERCRGLGMGSRLRRERFRRLFMLAIERLEGKCDPRGTQFYRSAAGVITLSENKG